MFKVPEDGPKYDHDVRFKDIPIGGTFFIYGDEYMMYDCPVWCECIKENDDTASDKGYRFAIADTDFVSVLIKR